MKKYTICLLLALVLISAKQGRLIAQDEGPPAMQLIAFSSLGGAGVGAVLGVALWLLDPLADDADIRNSVLGAMGFGAVAGTGMGIFQLQKSMVLPAGPGSEEEFYEEEIGYRMAPFQPQSIFADKPKKYVRRIPLLQFSYKF